MPTLQDNKLDPEQQEYEKNFDFERHQRELASTNSNGKDNPAERANMDRANAWSSDKRSVAEREAAPSWSTSNLSQGGATGSGKGKSATQKAIQKRATKWIVGTIVTTVISVSAAVPTVLSGAFVHMKELISDWGNKNNHSLFSKRNGIDTKKKYFTEPDKNCKGVDCRYKGGISDKEIDELKKSGLNPEIGEKDGKKYITALNTTDDAGKAVKVTADNFEEHYGGNVRFRAALDAVAKPKSMLLRGKTTLKLVFDKFGIKRNRDLSGKDDRERAKNFRADEYGNGNDTEKANSPPGDNNSEEEKQANSVNEDIDKAAADERQKLESSGFDTPPDIVPDTSDLDLPVDKAADVADGLLKGGIKGAVLGIFSALDKACSGYQLLRAVVFGAKIYKVIGLIKYAGIFMTLADKLKAGDSKADEIGFLASLLFRPSTKKESLGKTFFQSEGFNLAFQGKIADHRGLARFTTGEPFMTFIQKAKAFFEQIGANKESCKQAKSWYGQGALLVAGLATSIGSGFIGTALGVTLGASIGTLIAVTEQYAIPLLIQYGAGTTGPDPTDAEGGYGVGNAIVAAWGAFGHFTGSANGARILTQNDAAQVEMESNKEMAFENKVDNYGKNPFSTDSATSIPTQLAISLAPALTSPFSQNTFQTLASIVTSPFSLFGSSLSQIVTGGVDAQADINKDGNFCADTDYAQGQLAVDAFCNPIPGEKASTITDKRYDPQLVLNYMRPKSDSNPNGHDHINDDGTPKSDDFKKYIRSCVGDDQGSPPPYSPDGGGSEVDEDVDTRWCVDTAEEYTMFRTYITDSSLDSAHQDSVDGTLGQEDSPDTSGSTVKTAPNGQLPDNALCALGAAWPGQKVQCGIDDKFAALNDAFKKQFGSDLKIDQSYLTLDQQKQCSGNTCATPGASQNGCGLALDFGGDVNKFGTDQYSWMSANAPIFSWIQPPWAMQNGTKPDAGHWEYSSTGGLPNGGTCQL